MDPAPPLTPVEQALQTAQAELEAARRDGSRSDIAWALRRVGELSAARLQVEFALATLSEARSILADESDRYGMAAVDDVLAMLLCHLGRPDQAVALHLTAADKFAALGQPDDEAIARSWAWWALLEAGRPTEALQEARRAADLDPAPANLIGPAAPLADLGRIDEADRQLAEAPDDPDRSTAWPLRIRAHVEARRGDSRLARELFTQALELLEAEGDLGELRCCERQMRRLGLTGPVR